MTEAEPGERPTDSFGKTPLLRRGFGRAMVGVVVVVGLVAGLWALSSRSVSPDQRLADAEPPPAAVVDLEAERRVLVDRMLVRGTVTIRDELVVTAPGTASDGEGGSTGAAVVGDLPFEVGDEVPEGGVVAVVSDRPVIVVPMSLPMHRSLRPGDEGADVERLQRSLALLGYEVQVDGYYGGSTQAAVESLYEDRGFTAVRTGAELDEAADAAAAAADGALRSVQAAEDARRAASAAGDADQLAEADRNLQDARSAHAAARSARDEAWGKVGWIVPLGELVGISQFPVVVSRRPVEVGDAATGTVVGLSPSDLVVRAPSDPSRSMLLQPGLEGVATIEGDDAEYEVTIIEQASGADASGGSGEEGGATSEAANRSVVFSPVDPIPPALLGRQAVVEVVLATSDVAVLAVPTGAVRADSDGEYLMVVDGDTALRVRFTPGLAIGGWVEVTDPGTPVEEGDVVRAG